VLASLATDSRYAAVQRGDARWPGVNRLSAARQGLTASVIHRPVW